MIGWRRTTTTVATSRTSTSGSCSAFRPIVLQSNQQHPTSATCRTTSNTLTRRHYLYLPTSWKELELRWRPVIPRTIRIELLPKTTKAKQYYSEYQIVKNRYRRKFQRNVLQFRHNYRSNVSKIQHNYHSQLQTWNGKWKSQTQRFQSKVHVLKYKTSVLKQSFRLKRNNWNKRRSKYISKLQQRSLFNTDLPSLWRNSITRASRSFLTKINVRIPEYSESHWFGAYGRPLTSRDETGRFVNPWQSNSTDGVKSVWDICRWQSGRLWTKLCESLFVVDKVSPHPPTHKATTATTTPSRSSNNKDNDHQLQTTWLGHATCLLKTKHHTILTDPIFSERAGPRQELPIGVIRDVPVSMPISDLPRAIDVCAISHDHYDHLDVNSILELQDRVQRFVVPLGLKEFLVSKTNVPAWKITELEWWQSLDVTSDKLYFGGPTVPAPSSGASSLMVTCCPAQHWASRTFFDRNYRLWCGFFLQLASQAAEHRVYFAGDTGYSSTFPLFQQIQSYCGSPDLALLPIGAYEPSFYNAHVHMNPEQALQVHLEMQAKQSVGIHWGTFPLAEEPLWEPKMRLEEAARQCGANFVTVRPGESVWTKSSLLKDDSDWETAAVGSQR